MVQDGHLKRSHCHLLVATPFLIVVLIFTVSCGGNGSGVKCGEDEASNNNFEEQEQLSRNVSLVNQTELNLNGINGNITVNGVSGATTLIINAIKRVQSDSAQDAQAHLQDLDVIIQELSDAVIVGTDQPQCKKGREYIVDYTITLPEYMSVNINNLNGSIAVDAFENDVAVNNLNGNVTLTNINGSAVVELLNGAIESEVALPLNGAIDLNTLNGDIDLQIPGNTSASFSARVNLGNISITSLTLQNEIKTSTSWSGTLGGGQGAITLEAAQLGDINVTGI